MSAALVAVPFDTLSSCIFFTLEPGMIDKPEMDDLDCLSVFQSSFRFDLTISRNALKK